MKRIICIGNRYLAADAAGPRVFDCLAGQNLPDDVEIIDGGIAGLNLLGVVEGAARVVFVDAVSGYGEQNRVVVLTPDQVPPSTIVYDHAAGLPYLFSILPHVCDRMPEIYLVGVEGIPDNETIADAAATSIGIAVSGPSVAGPAIYSGGYYDCTC